MMVYLQADQQYIDVIHDKYSTITINETPSHSSIDYFPVDSLDGLANILLQDTEMMDFQSNISMLLRAEMKDKNIKIPLKGSNYKVVIRIQSTRAPSDIPLIYTIKSVIDGINREVIENDVRIFEVEINYHLLQLTSRPRTSTPNEFLSVSIYQLNKNTTNYICGLIDIPIFIVPKLKPAFLNSEIQEAWYLWDDMNQEDIANALIQDGMQLSPGGPKRIEMVFTSNTAKTIDLDNMARSIYPLVNRLGVSDEIVHSIYLRKQSCSKGQLPSTEIQIL